MSNLIKKITTGAYEVIGSGTVILFEGKPLEIEFGNSSETLKLILEFVRDNSSGSNIKVSAVDTKTLKFIFSNWENSLGVGSGKPIHIGDLGGKQLYFNIRSYGLADSSDLTLHYTLYIAI